MINTTTYQVKAAAGVLSHFPAMNFFVRDTDETDLLREARIRSGDYLMTLSTELEQIAQNLAAVKAPEAPELEKIVAELLYIERNYKLAKR